MKKVQYIFYRCLTPTDFFNMYKPSGTEKGGGGQSYIDIPISAVDLKRWENFFKGIHCKNQTNGPLWNFEINSIGLSTKRRLEIAQRRPATFKINKQRLTSRNSNRVLAWHPDHGFPKPKNPKKRQLVDNLKIFIVRTSTGEYWAGWFQNTSPYKDKQSKKILGSMLDRKSEGGFLEINALLNMNERAPKRPFSFNSQIKGAKIKQITPSTAGTRSQRAKKSAIQNRVEKKSLYRPRSEKEIISSLFKEDMNATQGDQKRKTKKIYKVLNRNEQAVANLKELYNGICQLTEKKFIFLNGNGIPYTEAHHFIPLGKGGADSPHNIGIVSPLIHSMFHHANVAAINLSKIKNNQLKIKINNRTYTIKWHAAHAKLVEKFGKKNK